jgi:hypothetical protein
MYYGDGSDLAMLVRGDIPHTLLAGPYPVRHWLEKFDLDISTKTIYENGILMR